MQHFSHVTERLPIKVKTPYVMQRFSHAYLLIKIRVRFASSGSVTGCVGYATRVAYPTRPVALITRQKPCPKNKNTQCIGALLNKSKKKKAELPGLYELLPSMFLNSCQIIKSS